METADKNALANQVCTHTRTRERNFKIDGSLITQRICTRCYKVTSASVTETAPATPEDTQYPTYWDCAPDLETVRSLETFRKLGWSLVMLAVIVFSLAIGRC